MTEFTNLNIITVPMGIIFEIWKHKEIKIKYDKLAMRNKTNGMWW